MDWTAFTWFAAALALLLLLERWIHRHLQGVALLIAGDSEVAVWLYALPFLPGILLHEISHALAALLVGVRVGRISIRPARVGEHIQLGFVPIEATGPVRTTIIGLAPLVSGCLALVLIGSRGLGLGFLSAALVTGDWGTLQVGLTHVANANDAWVWAYLAFAVSNTMLPSRSDMRAWPALVLFLLGVAGLVALLELGPALTGPLSGTLRWLSVAATLTLLVDLPFALLILAMERGLAWVKGVQVEYR